MDGHLLVGDHSVQADFWSSRMRSWLGIAALVLPLFVLACGSKDPETAKREFVASGDRYVAQKKWPEAVIQYRNAVGLDSRFGQARFKLAKAYQENGDVRNAFREYIRAADLLPKDADVQVRAAAALLSAEQFPEAQ